MLARKGKKKSIAAGFNQTLSAVFRKIFREKEEVKEIETLTFEQLKKKSRN